MNIQELKSHFSFITRTKVYATIIALVFCAAWINVLMFLPFVLRALMLDFFIGFGFVVLMLVFFVFIVPLILLVRIIQYRSRTAFFICILVFLLAICLDLLFITMPRSYYETIEFLIPLAFIITYCLALYLMHRKAFLDQYQWHISDTLKITRILLFLSTVIYLFLFV